MMTVGEPLNLRSFAAGSTTVTLAVKKNLVYNKEI